MNSETLKISEIFHSIQGESSFAGWPCTFIRLAGCGHGCRSCDTAYAENGESVLMIDEIIREALGYNSPYIEITGGEPLRQESVYPLMEQLCDRGETVLLETGGFLSVAKVDRRVHKIIDLKPPSTGVSEKNNPENISLALLQESDAEGSFEFKIVVADRTDYLWARELLRETALWNSCTVIMGTVFDELQPAELAHWILTDRLNVRMQLQLHKYIWPPDTRGV